MKNEEIKRLVAKNENARRGERRTKSPAGKYGETERPAQDSHFKGRE